MLAIYVSGFDGFTLFNNCFLVSAKVLDMSHTLLYCAANLQGDFHGPPCFSSTYATPSTVCSFLTVSGSPIKVQARVDHSVSHKPFWREHHTPVLNHRDHAPWKCTFCLVTTSFAHMLSYANFAHKHHDAPVGQPLSGPPRSRSCVQSEMMLSSDQVSEEHSRRHRMR